MNSADRRYEGLNKLAAKQSLALDIKAPPKGASGFTRIAPLSRVEHAFALLGRWRLARCCEGSAASRHERGEGSRHASDEGFRRRRLVASGA